MIGLRHGLGQLSERLDRLDGKHRLILSQVTVGLLVIFVVWVILRGA